MARSVLLAEPAAEQRPRSPVASPRPASGGGPVIVFADLLRVCGPSGQGADQGERVFLRELAGRLAERAPALVYSTTRETSPLVRHVSMGSLMSRQLAGEMWRHRPSGIVYIYPVTSVALLRGRLLKLSARGARTVMVALATHRSGRITGILRRLFWPDLVLVTSEAEKAALRSAGAPVQVLPAGVDMDRFRPAAGAAEKRRLRRNWGLPEERQIVLHVGHLVSARNLGVLARLAARPNLTPVVLISHVRDADSDRLRAELERAGVLVLEGYRPRVEELYRAADCYIFPSREWGGGIDLPLSVLEALASDLPVVCAPFGALPERFGDADGVRIASTDAEMIGSVEEMLRLRPSTRHLVEGCSWDSVADRVLAALAMSTG